nr:hypothetical protein [Pandoravirus massiliensis]
MGTRWRPTSAHTQKTSAAPPAPRTHARSPRNRAHDDVCGSSTRRFLGVPNPFLGALFYGPLPEQKPNKKEKFIFFERKKVSLFVFFSRYSVSFYFLFGCCFGRPLDTQKVWSARARRARPEAANPGPFTQGLFFPPSLPRRTKGLPSCPPHLAEAPKFGPRVGTFFF